MLIYRLFICYFNYFDLVFHIPYLNRLWEISTFFNPCETIWIASHSSFTKLIYKSCQLATENKRATLYSDSDASLGVYMDFYLAKQPWGNSIAASQPRWSRLRVEYTPGIRVANSNYALKIKQIYIQIKEIDEVKSWINCVETRGKSSTFKWWNPN